MPRRQQILATGQFYHIFNKTIGGESIFSKKSVSKRALDLINYYRFKSNFSFSRLRELSKELREMKLKQIFSTIPLVKIHSFSIMPNHYHFLLEQICDKGITNFISNFQNGLAKYYNIKYKRLGKLFLESFSAVRVETEELLIHITRYIHLNPVTAYLIKIEDLLNYSYTSFATYMGQDNCDFLTTDLIDGHFGSKEAHRKFVFNQAEYQRKLKLIQHLLLE